MLDLLFEIEKLGVKPCSSPMAPGVYLTRESETLKDLERYKRLVEKLNYLTVTHPDIAHSVIVVSQNMFSLTVDHWVAVELILCYLKGALGRGILYTIMGITKLNVSQMPIG